MQQGAQDIEMRYRFFDDPDGNAWAVQEYRRA